MSSSSRSGQRHGSTSANEATTAVRTEVPCLGRFAGAAHADRPPSGGDGGVELGGHVRQEQRVGRRDARATSRSPRTTRRRAWRRRSPCRSRRRSARSDRRHRCGRTTPAGWRPTPTSRRRWRHRRPARRGAGGRRRRRRGQRSSPAANPAAQICPCKVLSGVALSRRPSRSAARRRRRSSPRRVRARRQLRRGDRGGHLRVIGVGLDPRLEPRPGVIVEADVDRLRRARRAFDVDDDRLGGHAK